MREKPLFLFLLSFLIIGVVYWSVFVDQEQQLKLADVNGKLEEIEAKVQNARLAQKNMELLKKQFEKEQKRLYLERQRFVDKNDLSVVTEKLRKFARKYNLQLTDFSPAFDRYFASSKYERIIGLPIELAVEGKYLDAGRFLENWENLPFYLVADELIAEQTNYDPNTLKVRIKALLYTWNSINKEE